MAPSTELNTITNVGLKDVPALCLHVWTWPYHSNYKIGMVVRCTRCGTTRPA